MLDRCVVSTKRTPRVDSEDSVVTQRLTTGDGCLTIAGTQRSNLYLPRKDSGSGTSQGEHFDEFFGFCDELLVEEGFVFLVKVPMQLRDQHVASKGEKCGAADVMHALWTEE